jgi:OPA family glycerol-3-phosphate transporter-like MFS transporter 1/2
MAHFSRKCYSTVKQQLQTKAGFSALVLSEMDTTFMATYAAGNIISGKLGDTFNPTTVLAIGLFGSGACLFLINIALWFDFHGFNAALGNLFILAVYFLFGFFQSTGGPVSTRHIPATDMMPQRTGISLTQSLSTGRNCRHG